MNWKLSGVSIVPFLGPQLAKWAGEVASLQEATRQGAAPTVAAFLENAGQRDLLAQYQVLNFLTNI